METEILKKERRAKTMLLYFAIGSIVMLFAAFTSAYVVTKGNGFWVSIVMPTNFYYSTLTIVLSSGSIYMAVRAFKANAMSVFKGWWALTLILGLLFATFQFNGWDQLILTGNYASGDIANLNGTYGEDYTFSYQNTPLIEDEGKFYMPNDVSRERPLNEDLNNTFNAASGYFYILTFAHLLHLIGGLLYLLYVMILALNNRIIYPDGFKLKQASIYWHFLGILWIYLFFFLLFIH
jgi:cytochrome c oxidase subunit 3